MHQAIPFFKMQGSGNDFILLNNDELQVQVSAMPDWAKKLCPRAFGVGADGLIFLESSADDPSMDYRWHFFNADGSRAEMCGNGSRCAARLAFELGLAPARNVLGTDAGPVRAEVDTESKEVKVQLTSPKDLELNIDLNLDTAQPLPVHFVNTGVPHVIFLCSDPSSLDLAALGPTIRFHARFAPSGANVNLVQIRDDQSLQIRTYERGVEAETFACGTGAAAAAVVANALGYCGRTVPVLTQGREKLTITLEQGNIFLQGRAVLVYSGRFHPRELDISWKDPD